MLPHKSKLKFACAARDVKKSIYDFGASFIADNNIKATGEKIKTDKIKKFLTDQMIETDAKILMATQMDGIFLHFLAYVHKLRDKYEDKFKMKTTVCGAKIDTKEIKEKERKDIDTKDIDNMQKPGDMVRERKPWGVVNQCFFRPQRVQDN